MTDRTGGRRRGWSFARLVTVAAVVVVLFAAWPSGAVGVDVGHGPDGVDDGLVGAQVETPTPTVTNGTPESEQFHVENATVNRSTVAVGESVRITATVVNPYVTTDTRRIWLIVFGEVVDAQNVTVPSRSTRQVSFVRRITAPGTYEAEVNEASVTFTVVAAETTSEAARTGTGTASQEAPGFTALAAVVGLLAVALLARRRTR